MNVKERIREFLSRHFRGVELADDTNIFSLGFVNSMFAMQLVMFIEKEFGITVENEDLEFENFESVNAVADLVEAKTARAAQK